MKLTTSPTFYAAIAILVIATGVGIADAGRHHHHRTAGVYAAAALCETDKDYYATHSQYCDSAERRGLIQIRHRVARAEFPPVQSYDTVTVRRDHQAADDGGHASDRFIALQTADDVARLPAAAGRLFALMPLGGAMFEWPIFPLVPFGLVFIGALGLGWAAANAFGPRR